MSLIKIGLDGEKQKVKHLPPTPPFFLGSASVLPFRLLCALSPGDARGQGTWRLRSAHSSSSWPLLPPHAFPCSLGVVPHRMCSCTKICSCVGSPQPTIPSCPPWTPLWTSLPQAAVPAPPRSPRWAAGESLLQHLAHLLSNHGVLPVQCFALSYIHFPRGAAILAAGPSHAVWWGHWSWLELAVSGTGQPRPLLTEEPLLPAPCHMQTLQQYALTAPLCKFMYL